jgi:serine/threonine protein kinase
MRPIKWVGQQLRDYQIIEKIGSGGFGTVYLAQHVRHRKPFVVKILHKDFLHNEELVARFQREAQVLAQLNHPNIVQMVDFDFDERAGFFLILEWLKGQTLKEFLLTEGRLPQTTIQSLFGQLFAALHEAHRQGVIHRDLKPTNIMLLPSGESHILKLLDFGIAGLLDNSQENAARLTTVGSVFGSQAYMSPEQLMAVEHIDHRSDIFSCGALLVECITGISPFKEDKGSLLLSYDMRTTPPVLTKLAPDLAHPQGLQQVVNKALALDTEARFSSIRAFHTALQQVFLFGQPSSKQPGASKWDDETIVAPRNTPAPRLPAKPRSRPEPAHNRHTMGPSVPKQATPPPRQAPAAIQSLPLHAKANKQPGADYPAFQAYPGDFEDEETTAHVLSAELLASHGIKSPPQRKRDAFFDDKTSTQPEPFAYSIPHEADLPREDFEPTTEEQYDLKAELAKALAKKTNKK